MSVPEPNLIKWIAAQLSDITGDGTVSRLELWHAIEGEGGERLRVVDELGDSDADTLAEGIWGICEHDAATRTYDVPQRYVVMAFRQNDAESEPSDRYPFLIQGRSPSPIMGGNTEPPTYAGRTAQDMRMSDKLHQLVVQMSAGSWDRLMRENEALSRRASSGDEKYLAVLRLHEELLDRKHERDLEKAKEQAREARHEQMMGMFMSMAPMLLSQFMAGKQPINKQLLPSASRDQAVGMFLANLSEEEALKIFSSLEPSNKLVLMHLYQSYKKTHDEQIASTPEALRKETNGKTSKESNP